MNRLTVLLVPLLATALVTPAAAQRPTPFGGPSAPDSTLTVRRGPAASPAGAVLVLPALVARAELGTFQVVEIPVPREVPDHLPLTWVVEPIGGTPVLSRRRGNLPASDSLRRPERPTVLVTFSIPRRARAGVLPVASVRFSGGAEQYEVPVHLVVSAAQDLELTVAEAVRGVRPGQRFTLRYRLTNLGNTPEAVEVHPVLPPLWQVAAEGDPVLRLGVHGMVERNLTISVPLGSANGSIAIRLVAVVAGQPVASAETRVEVLTGAPAIGDGPVAALAMAFGLDPDGSAATGYALALSGQLTDGIAIAGQVSATDDGAAGGNYALTRTGLYRTRPSLQLAAANWNLAVGQAGARFSDLTGVGLSGMGGAASVQGRGWRASALMARPDHVGNLAGGLLAGGRLEVQAGTVLVSGTATHLSQDRFDQRRLDALSLSAELPGFLRGRLGAEVAQRWTARGSAPGVAVEFDRRGTAGQLSLRAMHAPGGSGAFARATDELSALVSRNLGPRLALFGSYWSSRDDGSATFGALRSTTASAGARQQLSGTLSVGLSLQHSAFGANADLTGFQSSETGAQLTATAIRGSLRLHAIGTVSEVSRGTRFPGQVTDREAGLRTGISGTATVTTSHGVMELSGRFDRSGTGSGTIPRQVELAIRVHQVPVLRIGDARLLLNGSLRRNAWGGFASARTTVGLGADAELPLGVTIGASAERNPFLLDAEGRQGGWLYGVRVARAIGLPRLSTAVTRGIVFQDLNGNGSRDQGEPGLANVIVRQAGTTAVSDADGSYRFGGEMAGPIAIDPASLPMGLLVSAPGRGAVDHDLPVVAVAPVEVRLQLATDGVARGTPVSLAPVIVMARHESGRTWVARAVEPGVAVFDALPPGRYQVLLDLLDLPETLESREALPQFVVRGTSGNPPVVVTLFSRRVAVKQLKPGTGPDGEGRR